MAQTLAQPNLSPAAGYGVRAAAVAPGAAVHGLVGSTVGSYAKPFAYDRDYHTSLVEKFETAEDASRDNRERAERDVDYYDSKQWTSTEVAELKKRGQPAITKNRIKRKIDFLQGLERSQRTDPRALPRTPVHEEDAHAATDALRSVCDMNKYDQLRSRAWADMLKAGWCGIEIVAEDQLPSGNPRVIVRRISWDRMFWDPYTPEEDFSDADYMGVVIWMDKEEGVRRWGADAAKVFDETIATQQIGGTFDDKPRSTTWVDRSGKRVRIRVVQMYHKADDGWRFCEFTKGGFLNAGPSPWLDDDGVPEHPYAWRSAYVDRDNNRYGLVRDMIDTQDEINKRSSKALHLFSVRQTFGSEGSLGSMSTRDMRKELVKPDGHVPLAPGMKFGEDFGVIPTGDMAQGQFELLQEAKAELDLMGPNAAMQGKGPKDQSGRAILAQQQGGQVESTAQTDTLRDMDHEVYRKIWRRIRQFWTAQEWVRVTDDQKNVRFVGLNVPVGYDVQGQPILQHDVAALDVDIMIDDAPAVSGTMQDEQFQGLVGLANVGVVFPPKVYLAASGLRNKGELMQMLDEQQQQQLPPPPDPVEQAANEVQIREKAASAEHKTAQARATRAQASGKEIENAGRLAALHAVAAGNVVPMVPPGPRPPGF